MGLPGAGARDHKERAGPMLDRETLLWLQPLQDVGPRLAESEAELLGHRRGWLDWLGSAEGPRAVGHRAGAGGSSAARRGFRASRALPTAYPLCSIVSLVRCA